MNTKTPSPQTPDPVITDTQRLKDTFFTPARASEQPASKQSAAPQEKFPELSRYILIQPSESTQPQHTQPATDDTTPASRPTPTIQETDTQPLRYTPSPSTKKISIGGLWLALGIITLATIISLFIARHEIIILNKTASQTVLGAQSLLWNDNVVSFSGPNANLVGRTANRYLIPITPGHKTSLTITLDAPLNILQNSLSLYLKNSTTPVTIGVVLKDTDFHSNSLHPFVKTIDAANDNSLTKTTIDLDNAFMQKTNKAKIQSITLFFYPGLNKNLQWVLLDDIVAIKKGETP